MILTEWQERKLKRLEGQGKRCAGLVPTLRRGLVPCLLPATLHYQGKTYCTKHHPPDVERRAVEGRKKKIAYHERKLQELRNGK